MPLITKAAQRQENKNAFYNFSEKTFRYRKKLLALLILEMIPNLFMFMKKEMIANRCLFCVSHG